MTNLGRLKVLDTFYTLYLWKDFDAMQKFATARDARYQHKKEDANPIDGFCDYLSKEIHVFIDGYTHFKYFEMTLRHELTHAYLYEIGYSHHDDEELIDKISKWIPQINNIFDQGKGLIDNARTKEELASKKDSKESFSNC